MPYNADGAWITQDGVGMPLSSGGIQSLTPAQIATPQQLQQYLQSNPGANANDLASLGYQPIDGSSPGATLPILQKWNPGGQVVSIAGKQYYKVNPAGGWHDTELSGTGSGFGDFFKSPVGLGLLAAGGAGAFGLLGDAAGAGLGDLAGAGDFIGGTGGMSTVSQAFNPVTGLFESVGGPMSTTAELTSAAAGGGFTGGATGSLLSNLANVPTSIPGDGTQSPAPVQEGPTNPSTGPGGSMPPIPGLTLPPGASTLGSLLQSLLGGNGSGGGASGTGGGLDLTKLLGTLGAGGLSAVGYDKARDTLHSIYDQITNARAPSLNAYNNAVQNPDTWYRSAPAMGAADAASRALSTHGNPADNPTLISQLAANQLGGYDKYLQTMSGPAFGAQPLQAQLGGSLATLAQGLPNALAQGLGSLTGTDATSQLLNGLRSFLNPTNSAGSAGTSTGSSDFTNSFNNADPFAFSSGPSTTFTNTSQPDLLNQSMQNKDWFGSPQTFGQPYNLNTLGSF